MKLPFEFFAFSVEMLAKTVQGIQKIANDGVDTLVGGVAPSLFEEGCESDLKSGSETNAAALESGDAVEFAADTTSQEDVKMADNDLTNSDKVKVVQYTILTIMPDDEHPLEGFKNSPRTKVFSDAMTGEDFTSWVIADYFQQPNHEHIKPENKKYLRVAYEVISTFDKEDANYDKEQVDALRGIQRTLARKYGDYEEAATKEEGKPKSPAPKG
jgi:hypothetical protein